ncbi:hypothetical protein D3C73_1346480 [compost metagenome]
MIGLGPAAQPSFLSKDSIAAGKHLAFGGGLDQVQIGHDFGSSRCHFAIKASADSLHPGIILR